jgi:hypothetical protein
VLLITIFSLCSLMKSDFLRTCRHFFKLSISGDF